MKKILLLLLVAVFAFSCQKDEPITSTEVPGWLQTKIAQDEATIKADPKLMQNYGAWIRYEFNGDIYFEYDNPLSSLSRNPYSREGESVNTSQAPFTNYWTEKCCEHIVWKAPKYQ
jgi:hypothetical protein